MKNTKWQEIHNRVESVENKSASWKSDKTSLLAIIEWADKQDIAPPIFEKFEISKLRSIIKEAKKAVVMHDRDKLTTLLQWVANLTTIELRHKLGIAEPETIEYSTESDEDDIVSYTITVRPDQFKRIASLTKSRFKYKPNKSKIH